MTRFTKMLAAVALLLISVVPVSLTAAIGISSHTQQLPAAQDGTEPNWSQRSPDIFPPPRSGHAMAYGSAREVTVLFGGSDDKGKFSDTWEWGGAAWIKRAPADSPPALIHSAMVYDSARDVTVLFGGYAVASASTTWEWDGTNWSRRFPANSPPARSRHAMAYDSKRGVTVLLGGMLSLAAAEPSSHSTTPGSGMARTGPYAPQPAFPTSGTTTRWPMTAPGR